MERQLRRGPAMAAVEEMAITPLPNPNRPGWMVEEVEEITAKLGARGPSMRDVETLAKHARHAAISSWAGRPRRALSVIWNFRCSVQWRRLTARIQRVNTAKPLIHCKNYVHEKCRPTNHLQLLFKDHHLIRHGSEITSSQSWLDPTENAVRTYKHFSVLNPPSIMTCGPCLRLFHTFSWVDHKTTFVPW